MTSWLDAAEVSGVNDLKRCAGKLRTDRGDVRADPTLQTEGRVTRLKLVKRQGYGRAKVALKRVRVLRAA